MARFYSNENIPLPVVEHLRVLGYDVLTSYDAGNANRSVPDNEVLAFAAASERIVLAMNRKHFIRLHRESGQAHAGIAVCSFDPDYAALAARIHQAIPDDDTVVGQLFRINLPG